MSTTGHLATALRKMRAKQVGASTAETLAMLLDSRLTDATSEIAAAFPEERRREVVLALKAVSTLAVGTCREMSQILHDQALVMQGRAEALKEVSEAPP